MAAKNGNKFPLYLAIMFNKNQGNLEKKFDFFIEDKDGKNVLHYISKEAFIGMINILTFYEPRISVLLDDKLKLPSDYLDWQFLISKKILLKSLRKFFQFKIFNNTKNFEILSKKSKIEKLLKLSQMCTLRTNSPFSLQKKIESFSEENSLEFKKISFSEIHSNNLNYGVKFSKNIINSQQKLSLRLKDYKFSNRIIPSLKIVNALRGHFIILEKEVNFLTEFSIRQDINFVENEWKIVKKKMFEIFYFLGLIKRSLIKGKNDKNIRFFEQVYEEKLSEILEKLLDFLSFNPTIFHIMMFRIIMEYLSNFQLCENLKKNYQNNFIQKSERFFLGIRFNNRFEDKHEQFFILKKSKKI